MNSSTWDERYNKDEYHYGTGPNDFLKEWVGKLLPRDRESQPARVLCLADGEGRNSVYLAELGAEVTALDISPVGLQKARNLADSRGVSIQTQVADLTQCELPETHYDGIVMIFCHLPSHNRPRLYQQIRQSLKADGWLLVEGYSEAQLGRNTGGPASVDLLLSAQELKAAFTDFRIEHSAERLRDIQEGGGHTGVGAVCQFVGYKQSDEEST